MPRREGELAAHWRASRVAARRRLDRRLDGLEERVGPMPPVGWIRTVRDALGMSTFELAGRLGVTGDRVSQFERAEVRRSIPLSTLDRVAAALQCRVCYVLVPAEPLQELVRRQAFEQAARAVAASRRQAGVGEEQAGEDLDEEVAARIEGLAVRPDGPAWPVEPTRQAAADRTPLSRWYSGRPCPPAPAAVQPISDEI